MRILLVEDDIAGARVASEFFRHKGHDVYAFHSAAAALSDAGRNLYQFAVIDVVLPDLNGFSLAEELLQIQPHLHCVLVTGQSLPDGSERAARLHGHFRNKPLDFMELEALFRNWGA